SGEKPASEPDESDDDIEIENGQLIFNSSVPKFSYDFIDINEPERNIELPVLDLSSLYIPVPEARHRSARNSGRFRFQTTAQSARRISSKKEISRYQKIVEELSLANPIYRDAIKKFFGQIES